MKKRNSNALRFSDGGGRYSSDNLLEKRNQNQKVEEKEEKGTDDGEGDALDDSSTAAASVTAVEVAATVANGGCEGNGIEEGIGLHVIIASI